MAEFIPVQYWLLAANSGHDLAKLVTQALKDGAKLYGNPQVAFGKVTDSQQVTYIQAVVK